MFFTYFLIIDKSDMLAGLFVVMMTPSFVRWMKSVMMSYLVFFRYLLMLVILELAELMINLAFDLAMGIITLMILFTSSVDNSEKVFLI